MTLYFLFFLCSCCWPLSLRPLLEKRFADHCLTVTLPGDFNVWLASPEAAFLKGRFVWSNWDVEELKSHAKEIEESMLLKITLNGVPM